MKMSKQAETLLIASIKHWKKDVLEEKRRPSSYNCPLCNEYSFFFDGCVSKKGIRCPIARTGDDQCRTTPYYSYKSAEFKMNKKMMKHFARKMIEFMEDLLP